MKQIPEHILALVHKFFEGDITPEEKNILDEWYNSSHFPGTESSYEEDEEQLAARMKERLDRYIRRQRRVPLSGRNIFLKVAAVILLMILSSAAYYYLSSSQERIEKVAIAGKPPIKEDITPGGNKAILTLADGTTITLDNASSGTLVQQGGTKVLKTGEGQLQYAKDGLQTSPAKEIAYNNIVTPRGGQYQVELADGTKVWLNASSSIRFPVEFTDTIRQVEITGEAYFEVAHNAARPFLVKVKDNYIRVLGTHFNIMAYDNEESMNTTLLEGSLKVETGRSSRLLKPGDKAVTTMAGSTAVMRDDNPEEAIAWVNGKFLFQSADIHSIMRQVERWYDVDVSFEKDIHLHFTGEVSRSVNVSELLRKLELTNEVHFRIEKKKIRVLP